MSDPESLLREDIGALAYDPLGFVRYAYPWGKGELSDSTGPRAWQAEAFRLIGDRLRNPETRHRPILLARVSGHGIGKSAFISQLVHWGMSTACDCRVVITANTEGQLRTKTWPEVRKWFRLGINAHWFRPTATSVFVEDPSHPDWRADAIPWSEHNTEAFQGLHNKGKRIILIMDEASAIPDTVWEAAEGSLTDENTEIIWVVFGNGTRATGRFREIFRNLNNRWDQAQIDSREVEGTNKALIEEWIKEYGIDSDFCKVRIRGMFPNVSAKQFFPESLVDAAWGRHLRPEQYEWAPRIIGVDPAWEGDDDAAIVLRQGLLFRILAVIPKNDNDVEFANIIARFENQEQADAVWIDAGYGTGIVSVGRSQGRNWQLVWFSGASSDPGCLNKRAEMHQNLKKLLQEGASIPQHQGLRNDLLGIETCQRVDGILQMEPKKAMKIRGLKSPNILDACAITTAFPDPQRKINILPGLEKKANMCDLEYDLYA